MTYLYLLLNLGTISIPFLFSFHPRLQFAKTWYAFWPACLLTAGIFLVWDVLFTVWGVWGFNPTYLVGLEWLGLPLEEWLFFICIPYACTFTYACLKKLVKRDFFGKYAVRITQGLIIGLTGLGLLNLDQMYTSVTFLLTAAFLVGLLWWRKPDYLGHFFLAYLVIYAGPFLLVNGTLTGSFIPDQVVWYNNAENFAIRVFTIPVEDFIYGMLLYIMNVAFYEELIARRAKKEVGEPVTA